MTYSTNNGPDSSREDFLLDLQAGDAQVRPYAEDDAAVTEFWEPLDDPEWIVVVGEHDRRMLSTAQVRDGLRAGELRSSMSAWRRGMPAWSPIASVAELTQGAEDRVTPPQWAAPHAPPPPAQFASCSPAPVTDPQPARPSSAGAGGPTPVSAAPARQPPRSYRHALPALPSGTRFPAKVSVAALDLDLAETGSELASDHGPSMRVKRAVMGLSALAMFCVFVTMFIISSAREGKSSTAPTQLPPSSAPPQTSSAEALSADESVSSDGASALPPSAAALLGPADGRP